MRSITADLFTGGCRQPTEKAKMAEPGTVEKQMSVTPVYFGLPPNGKTTNLMQAHRLLDPAHYNEPMYLEIKGGRTWLFGFRPLLIVGQDGIKSKRKTDSATDAKCQNLCATRTPRLAANRMKRTRQC